MAEPALNIVSQADAQAKVPDLQLTGNTDAWVLICKASAADWMNSTKAMEIDGGGGCIVQASAIHKGVRTEALTYVPGARIAVDDDGVRFLANGGHELEQGCKWLR